MVRLDLSEIVPGLGELSTARDGEPINAAVGIQVLTQLAAQADELARVEQAQEELEVTQQQATTIYSGDLRYQYW